MTDWERLKNRSPFLYSDATYPVKYASIGGPRLEIMRFFIKFDMF